jgi:hypothetical protein
MCIVNNNDARLKILQILREHKEPSSRIADELLTEKELEKTKSRKRKIARRCSLALLLIGERLGYPRYHPPYRRVRDVRGRKEPPEKPPGEASGGRIREHLYELPGELL